MNTEEPQPADVSPMTKIDEELVIDDPYMELYIVRNKEKKLDELFKQEVKAQKEILDLKIEEDKKRAEEI